jgi:hypothetical protein
MMTELHTEGDSDLLKRMTTEVDTRHNRAAGEAIRLGLTAVAGNQSTLDGPETIPRPTAQIPRAAGDDTAC